jgi:Tfp pilus assembly protein PilZ
MSDRRRETRKKVMAFTPVRDAKGGLLGYLADLTAQGAMVVGEKPLEANTQMTLSIELPRDLPGVTASRLSLPTRVARCAPDEDTNREFHIGFAFSEVKPEQAKIIQAILERYFFRYQSEE